MRRKTAGALKKLRSKVKVVTLKVEARRRLLQMTAVR
jgi:hypothetical protein